MLCFVAQPLAAQEAIDVGETFNNGVILKSQQKYEDAIAEFQRAIEQTVDTEDEKSQSVVASAKQQIVNCRIQIANRFYEGQEFEAAIAALEKARETAEIYEDKPNTKLINDALPRIIFAKGIHSMETKNFEEALVFFDQSITLNPNQSEVLLAIGAAYQRLENYEKALEYYEQTVKVAIERKKPADAAEARKAAINYLLAAGQEAKNQKYYDGAYKYFSYVTKFDDKNTEGYLQMAIVSNYAAKYKDAIAAAQKGIELEKRTVQSAQFVYQLAFAYEQNTPPKPKEACEYYQKAMATTDVIIKQNAKDACRRLRCK
ncbi:hypothetical protein FACS189452_08760 [Bacteroidia bacterium]|nr:hypothetical protein FACS189452_08760 [Bacteroidia bacterium]